MTPIQFPHLVTVLTMSKNTNPFIRRKTIIFLIFKGCSERDRQTTRRYGIFKCILLSYPLQKSKKEIYFCYYKCVKWCWLFLLTVWSLSIHLAPTGFELQLSLLHRISDNIFNWQRLIFYKWILHIITSPLVKLLSLNRLANGHKLELKELQA